MEVAGRIHLAHQLPFAAVRALPSIPTTTILAGQQFVIAALLPDSPLDAWLVNDVHTNAVGFVGAGTGRFEIGGTLSYPTQIGGGVYSVANASDLVIVPEPTPATCILFYLGGSLCPGGKNRASSCAPSGTSIKSALSS